MISKILDLLILIIPVIMEYFKNQRAENESPTAYVKRIQHEELKTLEAMQKGDGAALSRATRLRMRIVAERLRRKSNQSTDGGKDLRSSEGTRLRGNIHRSSEVSPTRRNED